ncbi:MAG: 2-oxo-4-hydroxy-4-carboxy-5-ureidoimidazoline decarboxylase [Rhodospirillales bacterium]|nr:2-oxo-4-hydroxy-4-carboxy-5-ureidoimidazoline decarboxylase [Rhodospirillales bacterium]
MGGAVPRRIIRWLAHQLGEKRLARRAVSVDQGGQVACLVHRAQYAGVARFRQHSEPCLITNAGPFLGLFEHSPWVVERAFAAAPFPDKCALHAAMMRVVEDATAAERLALIRAHPELGARQAPLTEASEAEQQGAGLRALSPEEFTHFTALNEAYREKFGFPFIICVRLQPGKTAILETFAKRLENDSDVEKTQALREIGSITWLRLQDINP